MSFDAPGPPATDFDWPMFGLIEDVRPAMAAARAGGRRAALATLYAVEGGAPRGLGAQMLFDDDGSVAGYLSGGCVEADVALHALKVLADGRPQRLVYGDGGPVDIALPCGSRIEVLVERLDPDDPAVARLLDLGQAREPAIWLSDGARRACIAAGDPAPSFAPLLSRRYDPALRALVIGGDPAALATARLLQESGVETTLARPKGPETPPPFPLVGYQRGEAAVAVAALRPDPWTAVCVMTHDLDVEHATTLAALNSRAGYIGVLGSRRRAPERIARLKAMGFGPDQLSRLNAPIGLDIGSKAPWHIAVAVAAEIVQRLHAERK
jgi:xanthine dehydrogenase accessory factor